MVYFLFVLGFVFLIKGADFLVDGASAIAKQFKISPIVIGLTIVSFGTSAPELIVNVFASLAGNNDLNLGNILGSNISNMLLILGVAGVIYPLNVKHGTAWKEIPFSLLAIIMLAVMCNDALIDGRAFNQLSRADGLVFLGFFIIFIYYTFGISKVEGEPEEIREHSFMTSLGLVILGGIGLAVGGKWIVDGATVIALNMGLSEAFIGLTIVGVGTSLPELATSSVAAWNKHVDIAVGNVIGSNIFNIFMVLAITSLIAPIDYNPDLNPDMLFTTFVTLILFFSLFVGKRHILERWQAGCFLGMYGVYLVFLVMRG